MAHNVTFSKEYNEFSHRLTGQFIHHVPVEKRVPQPDDRAFFDLVYTQLFEFTSYSQITWDGFIRNPFNSKLIEEIRSSSTNELKKKYFHGDADTNSAEALIKQLKLKIEDSLLQKKYKVKPFYFKNMTAYAPYLAGAMIIYSVNDINQYRKYMNPAQSSSNCTSGCSGGSSCGSGCGGGCGSS